MRHAPVPVPVRYRGEREPELEEAGTIGKISRQPVPRLSCCDAARRGR